MDQNTGFFIKEKFFDNRTIGDIQIIIRNNPLIGIVVGVVEKYMKHEENA